MKMIAYTLELYFIWYAIDMQIKIISYQDTLRSKHCLILNYFISVLYILGQEKYFIGKKYL